MVCRVLRAAGLAWMSMALAAAQPADPQTPGTTQKQGGLKDPTDGWPDLSAWLEKKGGFVPLVMPITEPAVGYGFAAFPVFLRPRTEAGAQGYARPNLSAAGGIYTSNGTWGLFGGDSSIWKNGRIETLFGGGYASANLKYYDDSGARKGASGLGYNLSLGGGTARRTRSHRR